MQPKPLAVMVSSLLAAQAWADSSASNAPAFEFDKVVVNATRIEQNIEDVSRPVVVVEQDEIESKQPKSVAQVLAHEPNILIEGGSRPGYQSVNIRGLGDNRVLQTVDGVRQDFQSGHRASYFLDPILLKSVEVVKGPASTLWGSGAMGGVVSQTTVSAADILDADQALGGLIKTGWNFNNDQTSTTAVVAGRTDTVDWLFSGYFRDSDDIETGAGVALENSASRDKGLQGKIEVQIDDDQSVTFNARHGFVEGGVPSNGSANVNGTSVFLIDKDQASSSVSADYRIDTESPLVNAQVMAYWNGVEIDESRVSDGRADSTEKNTFGLNINNLSQFGEISLLYGVDGYHSKFEAERGDTDRPVPPEADVDVWGAFVQAMIPVSGRWTVELGGRYDYFSTEANNLAADRSDSHFSPSAAIIWQTTDQLELTLRHDRAFRAPSAEELYTTGTHFCMGPGMCNTFISNPDLEAEKAANTELIANLNVNDAWKIKASVFENRVDDFIEQEVSFAPFPGNTTWNNVDEAILRGFEVSAEYRKDDLNLKLGYGQTRGEDRSTGDPLSNVPADTWSVDLSYAFLNRQLKTGVRVLHAEEQNRSTVNTYDDYTVTDLYASWEPASVKHLKVDMTINNLTDEHYRRAWSELDEAGREVVISATYKF